MHDLFSVQIKAPGYKLKSVQTKVNHLKI